MSYPTITQFIESLVAQETIEKAIAKESFKYEAKDGYTTGVTHKVSITLVCDRNIVGDAIAIEDAVTLTFGEDNRIIGMYFGPFTPWWAAQAIVAVREAWGNA